MNRKIFPFLMPLRSLVFIVVFVLISVIASKELQDISNTWSVVASAVNIITVLCILSLPDIPQPFRQLRVIF